MLCGVIVVSDESPPGLVTPSLDRLIIMAVAKTQKRQRYHQVPDLHSNDRQYRKEDSYSRHIHAESDCPRKNPHTRGELAEGLAAQHHVRDEDHADGSYDIAN